MGLFAALLMLNPIMLENGVYYDGKTVIFTILGLFSGFIQTIAALAVSIPLRFLITHPGNHWVSILSMLNSGITSLIIGKVILKFENTNKKNILYVLTTLVVNLLNIIIFLNFNTTNARFVNLIIPNLIVFPVITIISSYLYIYNINYNDVIKTNLFHKKILTNALDNNVNTGYITVDRNYKYLLFNTAHKDYIKEVFGNIVKIGDNYLNTYKKFDVHEKIKENINKCFNGENFDETLTIDNRIVEQKYMALNNGDKIIAVNILSRDITKDKMFKQQLIELSLTDTLTGFSNRRSYDKMLVNYNDNNFSVIYLDIDGLKFMNDAFGHAEGDKLILLVANDIKEKLEDYESTVYRLGGDEFIIILKDLKYNEVNRLANSIKKELSNKKINELRVSVSIGISERESEEETIKDIIKKAEKRMYDNKIIYNKRHPYRNIDNVMYILSKRDEKLLTHIENVERNCLMVAKELNFDSYNLELMKSLARLHDIGKINVDKKLLKHKVLKDEDKIKLKSHIETGYRLLSRIPKYFEIAFDLQCQYENYDGTGYSLGIKGKNIPLKARILRVVNYYDFLTLYSEKSHDDAIRYLLSEKGKRFDPDITDLFVRLINN